jgi:hypothetical protein
MQSNQLPCVEVDWFWVDETHMQNKGVQHSDLKEGEYRYDTVRLGYWIQTPSKTSTMLGLRGCRFLKKFGQTNY